MIRRRPTTIFSLAFLDCICCGFGAIILLFVLSVDHEDKSSQAARAKLRDVAAAYVAQLAALNERKGDLEKGHNDAEKLLLEAQRIDDNLKGLLDDMDKKLSYEKKGQKALLVEMDKLKRDIAANQKKPEMLLNEDIKPTPLGLPATSNYVAFIIDSSGSMRDPSTEQIWRIVLRKFEEVLDSYPKVDGVQFLDADGRFILGNRVDERWLPDTPETRSAIKQALLRYQEYSNSNPVPGIVRALRTLHDKENEKMKMTIFVLGDEFTGTADAVVRRLDELNPKDKDGKRSVVINAILFPTSIKMGFSMGNTGVKLSNLMRIVTYEHGGAFIALEDID
ncbi:MAG TPA: hypothetical protein VG936_08985 [Lacunisphaera sp.]|nr:hypothetical protein [Lacunisphaera sp.]